MTRKVIKKIFIVLFIVLIIAGIYDIADPLIKTKLSVNSLNGGDNGYIMLEAYGKVKTYLSYFGILLAIYIFRNELGLFIKRIRNIKNTQKQGE
jgi:hypothetical protein